MLNSVKVERVEVAFTRVAVKGIPIIGHRGIDVLREIVKTSFKVFIRTALTALPLTFLAALAVALLA
jgi:predicted neutral ceramidase superfamily lipid hydrolase